MSDERRRLPRRPGGPTQMLIRYPGLSKPLPGYLVDRSEGGLRLVVPLSAPEGMVLYVRERDAPPRSPWERAEVRWLRDRGERWEVGCARGGDAP